MDLYNLSQELKELDEKLRREGLPEWNKLRGKSFICVAGIGTICGTIVSVGDANDDGYLELFVSPMRYRGDLVESIWFGDGDTYLHLKYQERDDAGRTTELKPCSFQLLDY